MIEMFKEDALIIKSQLNAYASGRYDDEKIDKIIKEGLEEEEDFEEKKEKYYLREWSHKLWRFIY